MNFFSQSAFTFRSPQLNSKTRLVEKSPFSSAFFICRFGQGRYGLFIENVFFGSEMELERQLLYIPRVLKRGSFPRHILKRHQFESLIITIHKTLDGDRMNFAHYDSFFPGAPERRKVRFIKINSCCVLAIVEPQ